MFTVGLVWGILIPYWATKSETFPRKFHTSQPYTHMMWILVTYEPLWHKNLLGTRKEYDQFLQCLQAWHTSDQIPLRLISDVDKQCIEHGDLLTWKFDQGTGFLGGRTLGRCSVFVSRKGINSQGGLIWTKNLPKHSLKKQLSMGLPLRMKGLTLHFYNMDGYGSHSQQADVVFSIARFIGIQSIWAKNVQVLYWLIQTEVLNVEILKLFLTPTCPCHSRMPSWMPWRNAAWLWHFPWNPWAWRAPCGVASWRTAHWALGFVAMKPQNLLLFDVFCCFWNWGWEIPRRCWWFSREIDLLCTVWVVKSILLL